MAQLSPNTMNLDKKNRVKSTTPNNAELTLYRRLIIQAISKCKDASNGASKTDIKSYIQLNLQNIKSKSKSKSKGNGKFNLATIEYALLDGCSKGILRKLNGNRYILASKNSNSKKKNDIKRGNNSTNNKFLNDKAISLRKKLMQDIQSVQHDTRKKGSGSTQTKHHKARLTR